MQTVGCFLVLPVSDVYCGGADSQIGSLNPARRWLARHAAAAKAFTVKVDELSQTTLDSMDFLLSLLPGLEAASVTVAAEAIDQGDFGYDQSYETISLGILVDALAQCQRLQALTLRYTANGMGIVPSAPVASLVSAFSKLSPSLVKLDVSVCEFQLPPSIGPGMLGNVAPLTGLTDLRLHVLYEATNEAPHETSFLTQSLSAFKRLHRLELSELRGLRLDAGCLELPDLASLTFDQCCFADSPAQLPGLGVLSCLTSLAFLSCDGLRSLSVCGLEQLPSLQKLVCAGGEWDRRTSFGRVWSNLPADMGSLSPTLLSLDVSIVDLAAFPLAVTQLTALQCLQAHRNSFSVVPAGITALGRLETLELGRRGDPGHTATRRMPVKKIDASALGDLSSFPLLSTLGVARCEVKLSSAFGGAAGHGRLANLVFRNAYPAPECVVTVLQYRQELQRQGRGGVLQLKECLIPARLTRQDITPCRKFRLALEACGF